MIRSCRFDEIFADNEEDIVHPELKKYYRQSKYDCPAYEDPFPPAGTATPSWWASAPRWTT